MKVEWQNFIIFTFVCLHPFKTWQLFASEVVSNVSLSFYKIFRFLMKVLVLINSKFGFLLVTVLMSWIAKKELNSILLFCFKYNFNKFEADY